MDRPGLLRFVAVVRFSLADALAAAQQFPSKALRFIVGFPPRAVIDRVKAGRHGRPLCPIRASGAKAE